jgi:hypothetical protein
MVSEVKVVYIGVGIALFTLYFGFIGHAGNVVDYRIWVKHELIARRPYSKGKVYIFVINKKMII